MKDYKITNIKKNSEGYIILTGHDTHNDKDYSVGITINHKDVVLSDCINKRDEEEIGNIITTHDYSIEFVNCDILESLDLSMLLGNIKTTFPKNLKELITYSENSGTHNDSLEKLNITDFIGGDIKIPNRLKHLSVSSNEICDCDIYPTVIHFNEEIEEIDFNYINIDKVKIPNSVKKLNIESCIGNVYLPKKDIIVYLKEIAVSGFIPNTTLYYHKDSKVINLDSELISNIDISSLVRNYEEYVIIVS